MKRPRTVFGRLEVADNEFVYYLELRKDGLHVRRKHTRSEYTLSLGEIMRLCREQTELFPPTVNLTHKEPSDEVDPSKQTEPVPDLQKTRLVQPECRTEPDMLHAGGERPPF